MNASQATIPARPCRTISREPARCLEAPVVLFDVKGTLVDTVPATLQCWRETLAEFGHHVATSTLQRMSGLNGSDLMARLFPRQFEDFAKVGACAAVPGLAALMHVVS